jgi:hypothetical protein
MRLATNEHSHSLGQCSLKLLIQLIDADSVNEVANIIIVLLALEDDGDVQGHEDVIVGWASANWELVDNVLLGHKELDLGPGEAEDEAAILLDTIKLAVFRYNRICPLRSVIEIK